MEYKLSAKRNGKFWNYGSFKLNKWNNYQASFKVTPEFLELVQASEGQWLNFSAFENKPSEHDVAKQDGYAPESKELDDEIPF